MQLSTNPAYAALVPRPSAEEETALEESIKIHGQLFPIIASRDLKTNHTYIIDGHTRYRILKKLNIEPKIEYRIFSNTYEEMAFIINTNLSRRNLSVYDKVVMSLPLLDIEEKLAKSRKIAGTLAPNDAKGKSTAKIAKRIGVSTKTYERILFIIKNGDQKLQESVAKGKTKPACAYNRIKKQQISLEPSSFPSGKYSVIYIDPPWKYDNQTANTPNYHTLSTEKIIDFTDKDGRKITDLFADACVVYMWTTGPKLQDVFALGDCASITDKKTGSPYPTTAQHTIREAKVLAENITSLILRKEQLSPFVYVTKGTMAKIGK